jgi:hypothetical protein
MQVALRLLFRGLAQCTPPPGKDLDAAEAVCRWVFVKQMGSSGHRPPLNLLQNLHQLRHPFLREDAKRPLRTEIGKVRLE